jgi:hypothetical protein
LGKITILHHEANRPQASVMPLRYSRHYYDVAMLTQSSIKTSALANTQLLTEVVKFKQQFYPRNWANYTAAVVGRLMIMPPNYRIKELQNDYANMRAMIFGRYLSFDEFMNIIQQLQDEINVS